MIYYAFTIFLSAFLLFQVQPLISKRILPWFGGSPSVWTTCMLFFQVALLLGYFYAHLVGTRLRLKRQLLVHGLLMASALVVLPMIYASDAWKPDTPEHPTWRIIVLLSATVGLPYFVLATTSPLLQKWFTLSREGGTVYRLYALSNAGSLLALITYPSVIEPTLAGRTQAFCWSAGFVLFVILCGYSAFLAWKAREAEAMPVAQPRSGGVSQADERPGVFQWTMWLLLAAFASTMLLAVTNQMCLDVAVVPFLWVLPLGLYLLSFIICFDSQRWYYRPVFWPVMVVMCGLMTWVIHRGAYADIRKQIGILALGLFACCMVCHGELVRLKPHPRHLTSFYLMVSAGGALGGVFVTLIAPRIFRAYTELNIGIMGCFAAGATALVYDLWRRSKSGMRVPVFAYGVAATIGFVVLSGFLIRLAALSVEGYVSADRNFYGILRVAEYDADKPEFHQFRLLHGRISHGWQYTAEDLRYGPTSYYGESSGIGLMFRNYPRQSPMRVGVLGLGTGSIAVYGQPGDHFTFYEINSNVVKLATNGKWFTYLADSDATCDWVMGDARLSLERAPSRRFDALVLDAFAGDAVPVHLLTREAFEIYLRHLKPQGVIAVNVSNRHLDLHPIVWGVAEHFHLRTMSILSEEDERKVTTGADWILVSADEQFLSQDAITQAATPDENKDRAFMWTDDFSNLFRVIR